MYIDKENPESLSIKTAHNFVSMVRPSNSHHGHSCLDVSNNK